MIYGGPLWIASYGKPEALFSLVKVMKKVIFVFFVFFITLTGPKQGPGSLQEGIQGGPP
jgi:hypothetical protein